MRVTCSLIGNTQMLCCLEYVSSLVYYCLTEARNNASDNPRELDMPIGRRGLIVPQNTFLEDVIRRTGDLRKFFSVSLFSKYYHFTAVDVRAILVIMHSFLCSVGGFLFCNVFRYVFHFLCVLAVKNDI